MKRSKALPPVIARARFDAQIVIEIAQMNRSGLAEYHFGRHFAVAIADALADALSEIPPASLAATLKCDVLSDFQTSLPPAKALA